MLHRLFVRPFSSENTLFVLWILDRIHQKVESCHVKNGVDVTGRHLIFFCFGNLYGLSIR